MYDIVENNEAVLARCKELGITPLVLGVDIGLVYEPTKTSKNLLTVSISSERDVLESNIDALTNAETSTKEDFMHHRNSGLDQVKAHILAQRQNPYILSLRAFRNAEDQAVTLGRMLQNARLAKKFGIPLLLASFAEKPEDVPTPHDHIAFWRAFGVNAQQLSVLDHTWKTVIERSEARASENYVSEGVSREEHL